MKKIIILLGMGLSMSAAANSANCSKQAQVGLFAKTAANNCVKDSRGQCVQDRSYQAPRQGRS